MAERLFVLGHPVAHSKSPVMHNAAYRALGLDWEYGFADCPDEQCARELLEGSGWLACNVTMPFKPLAYDAAAFRSAEAELARGANVLVAGEEGLHADNTDGKGCVAYLERRGVTFEGARVAVCGTGPTSLAILHACARAGASQLGLFGREPAKTARVLDEYRARLASTVPAAPRGGDARFAACSYGREGLQVLERADVILDATPLGMKPGDPAPFDTAVLSGGQVVFDVVYGHGETALLAAARAAGCAVLDGRGMLVAQAVETVCDIADVTGAFAVPDTVDLFAIMAAAAGFDV